MRRGRIGILAVCLALALLMCLLTLWPRNEATPLDGFVARFDANIAEDPVAAVVVARDPGFRARVIRATANAFANGGWPAAIDKLDGLMMEKEPEILWTKLNADEDLLVTLWRRYIDTMQALQQRPTLCRFYISGGRYRAAALPSAKAEYRAASRAAVAAFLSGDRNLKAGLAFELLSDEQADALLEKSTAAGVGYTEDEWAALHYVRGMPWRRPSDDLLCAATIKKFRNVVALAPAEAAALVRYTWGKSRATRPQSTDQEP